MQAGYETIVFGSRMDDLNSKLASIAEAGFAGVEFSQRHEMLRVYDEQQQRFRPVTLTELARLLHKYSLTFLGLAGGTLLERIEFCLSVPEALRDTAIPARFYRPLYLYVDSDDVEHIELAAQNGFRVAIHPHVFMKLERVTAAKQLPHATHNHVFFMLDTAHTYIVGDDPVEEIRALGSESLIAVHLKDWDAVYGRSSHRYAKGFVPLGCGEVPLEQVLAVLREIGYTGWIIAEQDYARQSPLQSVHQAAVWFAKHLLLPKPPTPLDSLFPDALAPLPASRTEDTGTNVAFTRAILRAEGQPLSDCYATLAAALHQRYQSCHVSVWACSPARNDLCLLSAFPPSIQKTTELPILPKDQSVLGFAAETLAVQEFALADVEAKYVGRHLYWAQVAHRMEAKGGVAIPIPNRFNPHHIRFVVGLLQPEQGNYDWIEEAEVVAANVSRTADFALDAVCAYAAGKVNCIANETFSLDDFLTKLIALIKDTLDCQGVTLFLTNRTEERLEVRATTGLAWRKDIPANAHFYLRADNRNPTTRAWLEKKTVLLAHAQQEQWNVRPHPPRSQESGPDVDRDNDNILLMPIVSIKNRLNKQHTDVLGVIRCRNKRQPDKPIGSAPQHFFTDDDAAVLDVICQTVTPHIELRRSYEQRIHAIAHMVHELNSPVNFARAALDRLRHRIKTDLPEYFEELEIRKKYFERIFSLMDLNVRVVNNATLYGLGLDRVPLRQEATWLMGEVIAPAKSQVRFLLAERNFDAEGITYSDFSEVDKLYIDRSQLQQVCFNLLSNAIKYAFNDPHRFRVEILSAVQQGYYRIAFRDWGPGIDEAYAPYIFEEGVRGPTSLAQYVGGLGLGLWIVRRIVEAHGGYVQVTQFYQPTEITIFLPLSLRASPMKRPKGG